VWTRPNQWPDFYCSHSHCADRKLKDLLEWAERQQKRIVRKWCVARFLRVYYDMGSCYYIADRKGKIIKANRQLLEDYLIQNQLIDFPENYERFNKQDKRAAWTQAIKKEIVRIATESNVDYAGELAGYHTGLHTILNRHVLVTEGPKLITPREGDFSLIREILFNMFGMETREDGLYFDLWLKSAVESLYSGYIRPGIVLVLVGPKDSGKNLVQSCIISPLLGGRVADPTQFALQTTAFNDDMIRAEHLMIADQRAINRKSGEALGSFIKVIAGNDEILVIS